MSVAYPASPPPSCDAAAPPPAGFSERIAQFEATVHRLESSRAAFIRRGPLYVKGFVALTVSGFAGFAFGTFVGVWLSLSATVVSLTGFGMVRRRASELTTEILALRRELDRMRAHGSRQA